MDYVKQYQALDQAAEREESQAEEYRRRADEDRWKQCRLAAEAVGQGGYTRKTFGDAVGKHPTTIGRQIKVWTQYGVAGAARPSYGDAIAEAAGTQTLADRRGAMRGGEVGNLPVDEQEKVAERLAPSVIAKQAVRPDVARAIARNDEAREQVEDHATEHRARHRPDTDLDPNREGRQAAGGIGRAAGVDPATRSLRQAAGLIAEAVLERDELGIQYEDTFADALDRVKRAVAALEARTISEDDRAWLESIGAQA